MRHADGLGVEGDGAVGEWLARSVFEIAQYRMPDMRELHANLMMPARGEVHADAGDASAISQPLKREFCALSRVRYDAALGLSPRNVMHQPPGLDNFALHQCYVVFFHGSPAELI